jgi:hypothetical protein
VPPELELELLLGDELLELLLGELLELLLPGLLALLLLLEGFVVVPRFACLIAPLLELVLELEELL